MQAAGGKAACGICTFHLQAPRENLPLATLYGLGQTWRRFATSSNIIVPRNMSWYLRQFVNACSLYTLASLLRGVS
jgi:hypothetical protein